MYGLYTLGTLNESTGTDQATRQLPLRRVTS